jgi:hypothetical protein
MIWVRPVRKQDHCAIPGIVQGRCCTNVWHKLGKSFSPFWRRQLHLSDLAHMVWSSPEPRPLGRRNPTWRRPSRLRSRRRRWARARSHPCLWISRQNLLCFPFQFIVFCTVPFDDLIWGKSHCLYIPSILAKFSSPILVTAAIDGVVRNRISVLLLLFLSESLPIVLVVLQGMVWLSL